MARMRRELCFSAGSFTYAGLYQMWGRELPCGAANSGCSRLLGGSGWERLVRESRLKGRCRQGCVTHGTPYRLLPVLAVWAMRVGSMAAPVANLLSGGASEVSPRRAMT